MIHNLILFMILRYYCIPGFCTKFGLRLITSRLIGAKYILLSHLRASRPDKSLIQ